MSEWQPIETAPRDGAWLLLAETNMDGWNLFVGYYSQNAITLDVRRRERLGAWVDNVEGLTWEPTYWMPLPAPPKCGG